VLNARDDGGPSRHFLDRDETLHSDQPITANVPSVLAAIR
jgi:hypothetical protein